MFRVAVFHHDLIVGQQTACQLAAGEALRHLQAEVVGLRGNDPQEAHLAQQLLEAPPLLNEAMAGLPVVGLVFSEYLQIELSKRVDVPDGYVALHAVHQGGVGRGHDAQPQPWHAIRLRYALHHHQLRILFQQLVGNEAVLLKIVAEVYKRLVNYQPDAPLLAPAGQCQQSFLGNEVARGVVGIDEQQRLYLLVGKEFHQVVGRIVQVAVVGEERHYLFLPQAVGIFLKGGIYHAYAPLSLQLHQAFYQLGGSIAHHGVLPLDAEILSCQQLHHRHARGIFREQRVEVGAQLVLHALRGEVGVHQVAVVQHLGEAPVAAIAIVEAVQHLVALGKDGLGNVEVLHVVNLVPFLLAYGQCLQSRVVDHGDDAQHLLVVFVVAHRLRVGIEEGHILLLRELLGELVDVHRLVVFVNVGIVERLLRHEVHDVLFLVYGDHRSVHPAFVLCH